MTDTSNAAPPAPGRAAQEWRDPTEPTGWVGWIFFAGALLMMLGAWHGMMGFVAIFDPGHFAVTPGGLVVEVDYTSWGWVHMIFGGIAAVTGLGVLAGQLWARVVAIVLAAVGAIVNMAFLAASPVWTTLLITLDVIIIYALVVHGREMRAYRD